MEGELSPSALPLPQPAALVRWTERVFKIDAGGEPDHGPYGKISLQRPAQTRLVSDPRSRQKSRRVGRLCPMRCTCNRSVVPFTSASGTRRTKFRSLDQTCSRHLLYSPETAYFDSARSNAMAPSSTTTTACAPSRNSESIWLSESVVVNQDYSPRQPRISDRVDREIVWFRSGAPSLL